MKALVDWIKAEMEALGTPPAYSYRIGVYHGMEKVLKEIESGKYHQLTEKDATITTLRKALEEARKYPRQPNNEGGWTLKYDFLEKVSEMTEDDEYCSMEQVEGVLLCVEKLLGEGDKE